MPKKHKPFVINTKLSTICKVFLENESVPEPPLATDSTLIATDSALKLKDLKETKSDSEIKHKTGVTASTEKHLPSVATAVKDYETGIVAVRSGQLATATRPASRIPRIATRKTSRKSEPIVETQSGTEISKTNQEIKIIGTISGINKSLLATANDVAETCQLFGTENCNSATSSETGKHVVAIARETASINREIGGTGTDFEPLSATDLETCKPILATANESSLELQEPFVDSTNALVISEPIETLVATKYVPHTLVGKRVVATATETASINREIGETGTDFEPLSATDLETGELFLATANGSSLELQKPFVDTTNALVISEPIETLIATKYVSHTLADKHVVATATETASIKREIGGTGSDFEPLSADLKTCELLLATANGSSLELQKPFVDSTNASVISEPIEAIVATTVPHKLGSEPVSCPQCGETVAISLEKRTTVNFLSTLTRIWLWIIRFFHRTNPYHINSGDDRKQNCSNCGVLLSTSD